MDSLPTIISRNDNLPNVTFDFNALREEGTAYIAQLGHKLWTDFNVHDPGITILETLCYAINDLGYRTSFPIEDILTCPSPSDELKQFYTAREILTCCPVTPLDFRKLIIDVEGVKNAWLFKAGYDVQHYYREYFSAKDTADLEQFKKLLTKLDTFLTAGNTFPFAESEFTFIEAFKQLICDPGSYGPLLFCFLTKKVSVYIIREDLANIKMVLIAAQQHLDQDRRFIGIKEGIIANLPSEQEIEPIVSQVNLVADLVNSRVITKDNDDKYLNLISDVEAATTDSIAITSLDFEDFMIGRDLLAADEQTAAQAMILGAPLAACSLKSNISEFIDLIWEIPFDPNDGPSAIRAKIEDVISETELALHKGNLDLLVQKISCGADLKQVKKKLKDLLDKIFESATIQILPFVVEQSMLVFLIQEAGLNEYSEEVLCLIKQSDLPGYQLRPSSEIKKICDFFDTLADVELPNTFTKEAFKTHLEGLIAAAIENGDLTSGLTLENFADCIDLFLEKCVCWRIVYCEEDQVPTDPEATIPVLLNGLYHIQLCLDDFINLEDTLRVNEIKAAVLAKLCQYRNLGEDFHTIDIIDVKPICLEVEVDTVDNADLSEIEAQIIYNVQAFLNPELNFYSLEEMLDKGKACDEIFQSNILEHGFLCDEEVENARLRRVIYKSDLYNIIMGIAGVTAIKSLKIALCNEADTVCGYENEWCLDICQKEQFEADPWIENPDFPDNSDERLKDRYQANIECYFKPQLNINGSTFIFNKGNICLSSSEQDVEEKLNLLHQLNRRPPVNDIRDISIPKGVYRNLDTYYSIQQDFPLVYRVGEDQVPASFSPKRKGQVKQLKAFLTFFDQILANYLAQLGHVKESLSICPSPEDSGLYYQSLKGLDPGIDELFFNRYQATDILITRLEGKLSPQKKHQLITLKDLPPLKRDHFLLTIQGILGNEKMGTDLQKLVLEASVVSHYYEDRLAEMTENEVERFERRNQVLDHLMARFGEKFTDYVLSMCPIDEEDGCKASNIRVKDKLLACKTDFLKSIPILGSHRGKGLNYKSEDCFKREHFWFSENVAGLKRRVNKLLCLPNAGRTPLACRPSLEVAKKIDETRKCFQFVVVEKGQNPNQVDTAIFLIGEKENSLRAKGNKEEKQIERALVRANQAIKEGVEKRHLEYDPVTQALVLYNSRGRILATSRSFATPEAAAEFRNFLIKRIFPDDCESEGFHILEHILMRPTSKETVSLNPIEPSANCKVENAYSFWISVIASKSWPCFQEENGARAFFEQLVRKETPAHIGICFLWIDGEQMYRFEEAYQNWLYDLARQGGGECEIEESLSALVNLINQLFATKNEIEASEVCPEDEMEEPPAPVASDGA